MLDRKGAEVESARSGAATMERLVTKGQAESIDLVFMDWRMPAMDRIETTRALREQLDANDLAVTRLVEELLE